MGYEIVIGLEVHAELNTQSKIYCGCKNTFGLEVNTQCCPVCSGMPGSLPVLNEQVVYHAIKMGHALGCKIRRVCKQDRKNYFYPDLPKAYQISQFDLPLCYDGHLDVMLEDGEIKRFGVTRIHIEEDAGKLLHSADANEGSLVDFNRCGVPLIEIVSEPDFRSAAQAKAYLEAIKSILQYLDICDAKMQEGSIRCDINVSVRKQGDTVLGTRVETKNVNTFSGAVRAIEYEAARQIEVLQQGGIILQETRRWDDVLGKNIVLRSKEEAQDYRYFPEPDLRTIVVEQSKVEQISATVPELPTEKLIRYVRDFELPYKDAQILAGQLQKATLFEKLLATKKCSPKMASNWILGEISKFTKETGKSLDDTKLTVQKLAELLALVQSNELSSSAAKQVFEVLLEQDMSVLEVVAQKNLAQISDESKLVEIVTAALAQNQKSVQDYKSGTTNALSFLVGQCMKQSKGQGNPAKMKELLMAQIDRL